MCFYEQRINSTMTEAANGTTKVIMEENFLLEKG